MVDKIFTVKKLHCEKDQYDENMRCSFESKKGRTHSERFVEHAFLLTKPDKEGGNLIASGYADKHRASVSFFNKNCAVMNGRAIKNDEGEILVPSQKEIVCADSRPLLLQHIKENEA